MGLFNPGAAGPAFDGDLDGTPLVMDADGDTSMAADTDDTIDIEIGGADDFQFTANTFLVKAGSAISFAATATLDWFGTTIDDASKWFLNKDSSFTAAKTSDYASVAADNGKTVSLSTGAGNVDGVLPLKSTITTGWEISFIKDVSASNVSVIRLNATDGGTDLIRLKAIGDFVRVRYDGTDFHVTATRIVSEVSSVGVLCPHKNLIVKGGSTAAKIDIDANELILTDTNGRQILVSSFDETATITASGANGLDTGSEAGSTWYHVHAIATPAGGTAVLYSLSATAPIMPSGYTFQGLIGAAYNNSSSDFDNLYQRIDRVNRDRTFALSNGSATSYTSISLAAFVPPTARIVFFIVQARDTTPAAAGAFFAPTSDADNHGAAQIGDKDPNSTATMSTTVGIMLEETQVLYYKADTASDEISVAVTGWGY